jgi:hypothetical protein
MNYTDTQLKVALAKMLPDVIDIEWCCLDSHEPEFRTIVWKHVIDYPAILDTELLHVCRLVEETLEEHQPFEDALTCQDPYNMYPHSASWQQRTIALASVKGIEIN